MIRLIFLSYVPLFLTLCVGSNLQGYCSRTVLVEEMLEFYSSISHLTVRTRQLIGFCLSYIKVSHIYQLSVSYPPLILETERIICSALAGGYMTVEVFVTSTAWAQIYRFIPVWSKYYNKVVWLSVVYLSYIYQTRPFHFYSMRAIYGFHLSVNDVKENYFRNG